jgi:hypothetical protein
MRVCPKCFSSDVLLAGETAMYAGLGTSQNWYCKDCRYMGPVMVEMNEQEWKKLKRTPRVWP